MGARAGLLYCASKNVPDQLLVLKHVMPEQEIFCRSVNPIPTKGNRFCLPFTTGTPKMFHLPTSLFLYHLFVNIFEVLCLEGTILFSCLKYIFFEVFCLEGHDTYQIDFFKPSSKEGYAKNFETSQSQSQLEVSPSKERCAMRGKKG